MFLTQVPFNGAKYFVEVGLQNYLVFQPDLLVFLNVY